VSFVNTGKRWLTDLLNGQLDKEATQIFVMEKGFVLTDGMVERDTNVSRVAYNSIDYAFLQGNYKKKLPQPKMMSPALCTKI
jgi:basic membrane lipoprotein Med (substrate-binding protein (PBP1-ABC) superfamily)